MQIGDVVMVFNGKAGGMYCEVVGVTENVFPRNRDFLTSLFTFQKRTIS